MYISNINIRTINRQKGFESVSCRVIWMVEQDWIFIEHSLQSQNFYKYNSIYSPQFTKIDISYLHFMTEEIALKGLK